MDLTIQPKTSRLSGIIIPPGSKSYSHRAFILASLAEGPSNIKNPLTSGDVSITMNILENSGVKIKKKGKGTYTVYGTGTLQGDPRDLIDCGNSGTSARIFSALSLIINGGLQLQGEFFRRQRPIKPLLDALEQLGAYYSLSQDKLFIHRQKRVCKDINIRGDISSQFITALLFLGSIIECSEKETIKINLTTLVVSYPYLKITLNIMNEFGLQAQEIRSNSDLVGYKVKTGQKITSKTYTVPSDFSSAAFIIAAGVLTPTDSKIIIENLDFEDPQGDKRIIPILREMGAKIHKDVENKRLICYGNIKKNPLNGCQIDCKDIPDLFPILSVIGAFADGKMVLYNAENLRLKESDRISIMARELTKMGVKVEEKQGSLTIYQCGNLKGTRIDHNGDHRIAMACTVAALYAVSESYIESIDIVKDSYPRFVEDLQKIGASNITLQ